MSAHIWYNRESMSLLLSYLQSFTQRNPIIVGSTLVLLIFVGILFSLLPSHQVEDTVPLPRKMSNTQKPETKAAISDKGGTAGPTPIEPHRSAASRQVPAMEEPRRSKPAAARAASAAGFTVQVGSFGTQKAADQLAEQLKASGYPTFVKRAEIRGKGRTYRVRVGLFATREEAKRYGDRLVAQEKTIKSVLATIND